MSRLGICLIGAQPPPVHGMSMVNSFVAEKLECMGIPLIVVDMSPISLSRSSANRLGRIGKVMKGFVLSISQSRRWSTMYIGLSGGAGQLYEILFVILARLLRKNIFLHHHSFSYLDKPSFITKMLTKAGGVSSTHIVLCEKMGRDLMSAYKSVQQIFVLSNTAVMEAPVTEGFPKTRMEKLGYLSNISKEKGVFCFIDVVESLLEKGVAVSGIIAGPFQDEEIRASVMHRISSLPEIRYVGPKYGKEKGEFFRDIDVLLFPTRYVNEAEPLTVYEALAESVPVIAWERGCISEMLPINVGLVVRRDEDFTQKAVQQIQRWSEKNEELKKVSENSSHHFQIMQEKWNIEYKQLLHLMVCDNKASS